MSPGCHAAPELAQLGPDDVDAGGHDVPLYRVPDRHETVGDEPADLCFGQHGASLLCSAVGRQRFPTLRAVGRVR
jgi:hypothetical protein